MPDVALAHRFLSLSEESREIGGRLAELREDTRGLTARLGAQGTADWRRRGDWLTDRLNGLDEQMTRHTAHQGDLQSHQLDDWRQKAERLALEWEALNAEGRGLLGEATLPESIAPNRVAM